MLSVLKKWSRAHLWKDFNLEGCHAYFRDYNKSISKLNNILNWNVNLNIIPIGITSLLQNSQSHMALHGFTKPNSKSNKMKNWITVPLETESYMHLHFISILITKYKVVTHRDITKFAHGSLTNHTRFAYIPSLKSQKTRINFHSIPSLTIHSWQNHISLNSQQSLTWFLTLKTLIMHTLLTLIESLYKLVSFTISSNHNPLVRITNP